MGYVPGLREVERVQDGDPNEAECDQRDISDSRREQES